MPAPVRTGEYAARGEYHRSPDPAWEYYPTYLAKLDFVRRYLDGLPPETRVLDAGCGEGVLVEEYASKLRIAGLDANYASAHVHRGSLLSAPFDAATFDRVLCLDVLEHLQYADQEPALREFHRLLTPDGELLLSLPNLAHLQSRLKFLVTGRLVRTASEQKHPGDRPIAEYLDVARRAGFEVVARRGILPTVPVLTRWIRKHPAALAPLHRWLTRLIPVPGWCFLNLVRLRKRERA
jgi:SAM-dependent methyltransferase